MLGGSLQTLSAIDTKYSAGKLDSGSFVEYPVHPAYWDAGYGAGHPVVQAADLQGET